MRAVIRWELKDHAFAVVVYDPEGIPCHIHPFWYWLLIVLRVQLLLPPQHLQIKIVNEVNHHLLLLIAP